jgi:3,4-dihydroxy-9,10-secoandrosta-1,3,5(10)-triene-9,17-dione 4,5-dioxygenase
MSEVTSLGYVIVGAQDPGSWRTFAEDCLGLQVAPGSTDHLLQLRNDDRAWRLGIQQGQDGAVVALGFEVADRGALDRLAAALETAGFSVKPAADVAEQRQVVGLLQTSDPSGFPLEFFYGAKVDKAKFVSPRGARFVTGDQGLGHAVLMASDADETYRYYVDVLGFRVSDVVRLGPVQMTFTSPNPRHHTLAYGALPGAPGGALNHIMMEVDDIDVVGRALDYCLDHDIGIEAMLGRHTNDHMISFYCRSPSGLVIEYGYGGRRVNDSTHVTAQYDSVSLWGHRPPDGRDREAEMRKMIQQQADHADG